MNRQSCSNLLTFGKIIYLFYFQMSTTSKTAVLKTAALMISFLMKSSADMNRDQVVRVKERRKTKTRTKPWTKMKM